MQLQAVVGAHAIGALAGLVAYVGLASDATLAAVPPPGSTAGLRLAASGIVSMALTAWGMLVTDAVHGPACATTLIVSLSLLATLAAVAIIVASVCVLVGVHVGWRRLHGV